MIFGGNGKNTFTQLNAELSRVLKPIMQNWSKTEVSNEITVYGIRRYLRGSSLLLHVDRKDLRIFGAILQESTFCRFNVRHHVFMQVYVHNYKEFQ